MAHSVLVVDDEPNIVLSLEFLMKQAGHEVRVARNGEQALKAVAEAKPDLILLDVMMPGQNGYDLTKEINLNVGWSYLSTADEFYFKPHSEVDFASNNVTAGIRYSF